MNNEENHEKNNERYEQAAQLIEVTASSDMTRRLMEMNQLYESAIREVRTRLEVLDAEFRVKFAHNPIHQIDSRLKSPQSIIGKLRRKGLPISIESAEEHLTDIAGVRVICGYPDDIYRIADLLLHQRDVEFVRSRDYIANPKESGYRSLHIVIRIPVYLSSHTELVPVEVQIRTMAMDFWASLEHKLHYKSDLAATDALAERLRACAEASAALDLEMQSIYRELTQGTDAENNACINRDSGA